MDMFIDDKPMMTYSNDDIQLVRVTEEEEPAIVNRSMLFIRGIHSQSLLVLFLSQSQAQTQRLENGIAFSPDLFVANDGPASK